MRLFLYYKLFLVRYVTAQLRKHAALALEMYSSSSFKSETTSFFSAEALPVLDGIFNRLGEAIC